MIHFYVCASLPHQGSTPTLIFFFHHHRIFSAAHFNPKVTPPLLFILFSLTALRFLRIKRDRRRSFRRPQYETRRLSRTLPMTSMSPVDNADERRLHTSRLKAFAVSSIAWVILWKLSTRWLNALASVSEDTCLGNAQTGPSRGTVAILKALASVSEDTCLGNAHTGPSRGTVACCCAFRGGALSLAVLPLPLAARAFGVILKQCNGSIRQWL
jgi:hypothetical protein